MLNSIRVDALFDQFMEQSVLRQFMLCAFNILQKEIQI